MVNLWLWIGIDMIESDNFLYIQCQPSPYWDSLSNIQDELLYYAKCTVNVISIGIEENPKYQNS